MIDADNYIFDGEIHPLSEKFCYILKYFSMGAENWFLEAQQLREKFLEKYTDYLEFMLGEKTIPNEEEDYIIVFRPVGHMQSALIEGAVPKYSDRGVLSMKFKRLSGDERFFERDKTL